ncbi:MAG: hypothetical protein GF400_07915 [Candidatus Eisenbacteria bacterium]|nr:hypothetical protein [Candidatus Eisenbacteria bacterium]
MAHAYTPGLKVAELTVFRKDRRLPIKGEVLVNKGDDVRSDTVVARTHLPGNVQLLNIASKLGIPAEDLPTVMKKEDGEKVGKGEAVAETQGFFGLFKSRVPAPCDGTLESVSKITGQAIFREPPTPIEIDAYIDGKVVDIIEEEGVVVETVGSFIQGIFGVGGERTGEIKVLVDGPADPLDASRIDGSCEDKVLVGGSHVTWDALQRAMEVGASGVVVGGFDDPDLRELLGKDIGVAITGQEDLRSTLILTEGFGEMSMAPATFDLLRSREGRKASINGATQIRAGVIRPEIVVPLEGVRKEEVEKGHVASMGLDVGSRIRVIREPNFGSLGEVVDLPNELRKMESETMVRVLSVKLDDGQEVLLPRANVEMIER